MLLHCFLCFVMLSQFILSLSKESIAVRGVLLCVFHCSSVFSTFCLDAKGDTQKSRQTRTAPPVLPPTHSNTPLLSSSLSYLQLSNTSSFKYNFFKCS